MGGFTWFRVKGKASPYSKYPENKHYGYPEFSRNLNLLCRNTQNVLRGLRWAIITPGYAVYTCLIKKLKEKYSNSTVILIPYAVHWEQRPCFLNPGMIIRNLCMIIGNLSVVKEAHHLCKPDILSGLAC